MNANNYDPYAESFEITPEYKMSLFGQSGRMSGVISNTGYKLSTRDLSGIKPIRSWELS